MEKYIVVETNMHTNVFDRQCCAFLTAQYGECEIGKEIAVIERKNIRHIDWWDEHVKRQADNEGVYRPVVTLGEEDTNSNNALAIFIKHVPTEAVWNEFLERLKLFEDNYNRKSGGHLHIVKASVFAPKYDPNPIEEVKCAVFSGVAETAQG